MNGSGLAVDENLDAVSSRYPLHGGGSFVGGATFSFRGNFGLGWRSSGVFCGREHLRRTDENDISVAQLTGERGHD